MSCSWVIQILKRTSLCDLKLITQNSFLNCHSSIVYAAKIRLDLNKKCIENLNFLFVICYTYMYHGSGAVWLKKIDREQKGKKHKKNQLIFIRLT